MENYLLEKLDNYFSEVLLVESELLVTEVLLLQKVKEIINENREYKSVVQAGIPYADISFINSNNNLFMPRMAYLVHTDNLENETEKIMSYHSCMAVSQVCEAFESFLIDSITEHIFRNQNLISLLKLKNIQNVVKSDLREEIRMGKGKNNKGLFAMIRKMSNNFKLYETKNTLGSNISHWMELIFNARHLIIHTRRRITDLFKDYLHIHQMQHVFDKYFTIEEVNNVSYIFLTKAKASEILFCMNSVAYFIFKSLSIEAKMTFDVPQLS